jgi:tetratricopeptide (TPR) repeat protein
MAITEHAGHRSEQLALDTLGILAGTDKSSIGWDYLRHYQRELSPFRDQQINLLEIGVAGGSSLQIWNQFFSLAEIIGIDITPECKRFAGGRIKVEIGSQVDPVFLDQVCDAYPPTVIIDDGSHRADHIRFSFEHLFPRLSHGGCYVVEDLHFHYSPPHAESWRGDATASPQEYFMSLANKVLAAEFGGSFSALPPQGILAAVDRIAILPRAIVIWKVSAVDLDSRVSRWETLANASQKDYNWTRLSRLLLDAGSFDRAEHAARMGLALNVHNVENHLSLAAVFERKGNLAAALSTLEEAGQRAGSNRELHQKVDWHLARLQRRSDSATR